MKSTEIFAHLSPGLTEQVLGWLHSAEKPTYKVAVQTLATQRKLRPIFVERKPRAERHEWMKGALSRPAGEPIAANLIQMWLMGSQASLLCDFLDALGIEHDEHGGIDALPETPDPEKLRAAVETVLTKHPAEIVAVYLQSFQTMDIAGWPVLGELLAQDARLHLPNATPAPAPIETPAHG